MFENAWIKITASLIVLIVSGVGAVVLERMGSLQEQLGGLSNSVLRVQELDGIKERLISLELIKTESNHIPHAQLSSAVSQYPSSKGAPVEMENVDSLSGIDFDPRKSKSKVTISRKGEYLFLIAPQVQRKQNMFGAQLSAACVDMWLRINGKDLNNSSVRQCWGADSAWQTTTVLMLQATLPMMPGESVQIMMRSNPSERAGAVAIRPANIPLIPSVIVTILKVG